LAADALRVLRAAGLDSEVHFVETSAALRAAQLQLHPDAEWHETLLTLPEGRPLLLVANEFLDALPIRQFVDGVERRVTVAAGGLAFDRAGEIVEDSPARVETVSEVAKQLGVRGGVALIIDYGHERSSAGDTLQAVRAHSFAPVLANPGEQDLTSHVEFEAVVKAAKDIGAAVTPLVTQSEWLERLGIRARAEALARAHPNRREEIEATRRRLCDPGEMGELFKVLAIHSPKWPQPAGFE
jgi:SAM-dependent MidA family methyltransferase